MKRSFILSRLLAIFLIAGLVTAPLSVVAATNAMAQSMSMKSDMPCCPDKSAPVDCDKCALMAMCMTKTFLAHPADVLVQVFPSKIRTLVPVSDPETESLGYPPPPRPPRSPVMSA